MNKKLEPKANNEVLDKLRDEKALKIYGEVGIRHYDWGYMGFLKGTKHEREAHFPIIKAALKLVGSDYPMARESYVLFSKLVDELRDAGYVK